nr:fatty acid binding protein 1-A, liver-like isoform X1 [Ciona intestinalis]|eukprot:XP_004227359.1 fatty acid binding protein 1-A, liver-like isoform X1 [Ciona intestinalis]
MAFTGTWVQTSAENADGVLRYVGMPVEQIKEMTSLPVTVELKQDGDNFFEKFTVGTNVMDVFFHVGKESLIPLITGGEVKTVPRYDGPNKTVAEYDHKGVHYYGYRELLSPTEFVDHMDLDHGKCITRYFFTKQA